MTLVGDHREIDGKLDSLRVSFARDSYLRLTLRHLQLGSKLNQAI